MEKIDIIKNISDMSLDNSTKDQPEEVIYKKRFENSSFFTNKSGGNNTSTWKKGATTSTYQYTNNSNSNSSSKGNSPYLNNKYKNIEEKAPEEELKKLYVDGLSYISYFQDLDNNWNLEKPINLVRKFVKCCRNTGFEPIVFLDGTLVTELAYNEWDSRKEKLNLVTNSDYIFYDCFVKNKVEVYFSSIYDCDDIVAAYANASSAYVLSKNTNFYRYIDSKFTLYNSYTIDGPNNKIIFNNNHTEKVPKQGVEPIEVLKTLPKLNYKWEEVSLIKNKDGSYMLRRNYPIKYIQNYGNIHISIKKLRQALYYHIFKKTNMVVTCQIPNWNKEKGEFEWYFETVSPDNELEEQLFDPIAAVNYFKKDISTTKGEDYDNYVYSCIISILELCSIALNCSLLDLMFQARDEMKK